MKSEGKNERRRLALAGSMSKFSGLLDSRRFFAAAAAVHDLG
ncbi:hypothetical protein SAMCCGM7_pC0140 (plasmid) [Sinorhizobium americanum CCGM7]|nr:hypothetical protein SAMCCGM7_pC0140 [Sinorhizobium americanum CCGM7]